MNISNNNELDQFFAINKDSYKKEFFEVYEKFNLSPKSLIQFPVILPFDIPFDQGICSSFVLKNDNICTLHFSTVQTQKSIHAGIVSREPITTTISKTRVEMTYVTSQSIDSNLDKKFLSNIFDKLVSCLNYVITAYLVYKKDVDIYTVSKEMFEFGSIYRIIPLDDWDEMNVGLFLMNDNIPYQKNMLNENEIEEIIRHSSLLYSEKNPFILSEKYILKSKGNFKNGFYEEAVINCQISIETFLSALISKLLELEGNSVTKIKNFIEDTSFIGMVKKEFHPRIGGHWDPYDSSKIIGKWYLNSYKLRNKIAHAGYSPNYKETQKALASAINFRTYIGNLINEKEDQYPEINKYYEILI